MLISDYFTVQYGQKEYESKSRIRSGKTPLISSASIDNGLYGFCDIEPKFLNVISFPRTGSIGEARVHDYPCCIDNNCLVLVPKIKISLQQLYYAASILRSQKWRFKYGRQATDARINNIELPLMEMIGKSWEIPCIDIDGIKLNYGHLMTELNGQCLGQLFDILKGEGSYFQKCRPGKTPMISASEMDNGVIGFVELLPTFKAPCITIERIRAKAHVQTMDFITVPDDIFVLKPKRDFAVEELFFVATLLNLNRWRFNYSRKVTKPRLERIMFQIDADKKLVQLLLTPYIPKN